MKTWTKSRLVGHAFVAGVVAVCYVGAYAAPAFAGDDGDCHFHGDKAAKEATVLSCADKQKTRLIAQGTIESSWSGLKPSSIEQVDGKKGKEWKVVFKNAALKDKAKETLYMFFTIAGNFIAANFTGN